MIKKILKDKILKDKILIAVFVATLTYSIIYKIQIEDSIIEDVKQENRELFEEASAIEPIDAQYDMDDTLVPIYDDGDEEVLDEVDFLIDEALGIYYEIFFFGTIIWFGIGFYFLTKIQVKI